MDERTAMLAEVSFTFSEKTSESLNGRNCGLATPAARRIIELVALGIFQVTAHVCDGSKFQARFESSEDPAPDDQRQKDEGDFE